MVTLQDAELKRRMGLGKDHRLIVKFSLKGFPSGRRFAYEEALDDHQEKSNSFCTCRYENWYERHSLSFAVRAYFPV
jgi:hypothetical protein